MKKLIKSFLELSDYFLFMPVILSGLFLKFIRKAGMKRMKVSRYFLVKLGVFPIIDHYYEPIFNYKKLSKPLLSKRALSGINWNVKKQIKILSELNFSSELLVDGWEKYNGKQFYFGNGSFESGDAEYLYNFIRYTKPKRVIEIGSGFSTLIIKQAMDKNLNQDQEISNKIICIEPYEQPWLETIGVEVIRKKVENLNTSFFEDLGENDLLFIDSSHIIRPHGDVIFELLDLLPSLNKGVYVHFHDIFSPNDYPHEWLFQHMRFWNEQYLLEAFLTNNSEWEIIGALNYLSKNHYNEIREVCSFITKDRDPGSFYIRKK